MFLLLHISQESRWERFMCKADGLSKKRNENTLGGGAWTSSGSIPEKELLFSAVTTIIISARLPPSPYHPLHFAPLKSLCIIFLPLPCLCSSSQVATWCPWNSPGIFFILVSLPGMLFTITLTSLRFSLSYHFLSEAFLKNPVQNYICHCCTYIYSLLCSWLNYSFLVLITV